MSRSRRNRLLGLVARVNAARVAIVDRHEETGEYLANRAMLARMSILLGRRARLLRAYLDDTGRAPR